MDEAKLQPVIDRFNGVCLGVAAALVDENVASIEDTDRGAKIGLRWSMGPFELINRLGIDKAYEVVSAIVDRYPDFNMPQILENQKAAGKPFVFNFVDLDIKDNIAYISFGGGCQGCGLIDVTMKQGVEVTIREAVPQIKQVLDTTDHTGGTNPYHPPGE